MEIHLEKVGKKIVLTTPYGPDIPTLCKSVPGAKFNRENKTWEWPLDWHTCLQIRQNIANPSGRDIAFGEDLYEWATAEKQRQAAIPESTSLEGVELPGLRERNRKIYDAVATRPFQTVGIAYGASNRRLILGDDPGLGKTVQTLGAVEEAGLYGPILVVTNTSAQQVTWPNEIENWTDDEYLIFSKEIPASQRDAEIQAVFEDCRLDPKRRIWVLANPFWVRMKAEVDDYGKYVRSTTGVKIIKAQVPAMFTSGEWAGVVADESHETLACETGNLKKQSQQRVGMGALPIRDDGIRISISGTPMRGKATNMYGQLNWVAPEHYTSYWNWAKRHFQVTADGYRGAMEVGEMLDPERFYKENARYLLRRSKSQVAKDLPPKQYGGTHLDPKDPMSPIGVWLPMLPEQQKEYDHFAAELSHTDEEAGLDLGAIGLLAQMTRLKQFSTSCGSLFTAMEPMFKKDKKGKYLYDADDMRIPLFDEEGNRMYEEVTKMHPRSAESSNKYQWILEFLKDRDLAGKGNKGKGKVIIASQFRTVLDSFREALEGEHCPSFAITGETHVKDRRRQQDEFQKNPNSPKVFFLQSVAGGTSLTLDQADDVIICDEMWDPSVQEQIEDRAHRLSRIDHNVTIWYLRSKDSIEQEIAKGVNSKWKIVREVMDGQRGVDYTRVEYEQAG